MNDTLTNTRTRCRRVIVGTAVAAGTIAAGAGTTFATAPTPEEQAGEAIGDLVDQGVGFIGTYAIPAAATALGMGLVLAILVKVGRKVRGWLG